MYITQRDTEYMRFLECTERTAGQEISNGSCEKLHTAMPFLFGVVCIVFGSVFGKLHENCTGTAHVFGVLLVGMRMGSSASCFLFLFLFFLDAVCLSDLSSAYRRVLEVTKIG